jgi:hypothetical protein
MDKIQEYLDGLGWNIDMLVKHLGTLLSRKERDKERNRQYFLKNKQKVYEYHRKYRQDHPDYVLRKRELDKISRDNKPIKEQNTNGN